MLEVSAVARAALNSKGSCQKNSWMNRESGLCPPKRFNILSMSSEGLLSPRPCGEKSRFTR